MKPSAPIGVFDSGIGGLSVLQALRAELPHDRFIYLADSAHAPYGERDDAYVIDRALTISRHLRTQHAIKALVVACNTATAAAIHLLRQQHPDLPIVGVEPALKPAAATSQTHRIGVLATRTTLASAKFDALRASLAMQAEFVCQPCDGLARAIEADDPADIERLCRQYMQALGGLGTAPGSLDTIVLGCTHYPFATEHLTSLLPDGVRLLDSGAPVARQTRRLLDAAGLLSQAMTDCQVELGATGQTATLQTAGRRWLQLDLKAAHWAI